MARTIRSHLPGAVFHLTARTQGREPWFTDAVRSRIVELAATEIGRSDARLMAYAIMSNHLHLVLRQGERPLGKVMQPFLRGVALLVQRTHGVEGHVFERRFGDRPCLDPDYARTVIVYTHLNPVRAGLVDRPAAYRWSSQAAYEGDIAGPRCMTPVLAIDSALRLFAPREGLDRDQLRRAYGRYVGWRLRCDRQRATEEPGDLQPPPPPPPPPPPVRCGDACWLREFAPPPRVSQATRATSDVPMQRRTDLADIAKQTLAAYAPNLDLRRVRSSEKGRAVVSVRRTMVLRMSAAGHQGSAIARYLGVSDACVSKIVAADRHARSNAGQ
jgi:REP element-mobilizing transposase RayT